MEKCIIVYMRKGMRTNKDFRSNVIKRKRQEKRKWKRKIAVSLKRNKKRERKGKYRVVSCYHARGRKK